MSAVDAAPGSLWPTLRGPRWLARPFSACMGMVAFAAAEAASASTDRASSRDAPAAIAWLKALVAAWSASTRVLTRSRAAPSPARPPAPR